MKEDLYLIDGSAYIYRAYFAIRNLTNSKGFPTNAVYGFIQILLKLFREKKPKYVSIFFDSKGKTFRNDIYKEYKANRPKMPDDLSVQIPYIKEIVKAFRLNSYEMEKFEADDLIGSILNKAKDFNVIIITGDKDFKQLLSDNVSIWDPMKDNFITSSSLKEKMKIKPDQIIDFMALTGDKSDNVPGVKGIGEKTAINLINEFGSLENLYENIDKIKQEKQRQKLLIDKDNAYLSKKLVEIKKDINLDFNVNDFLYKEPVKEDLYKIFKELDFNKFLKDLDFQKEEVKKNYKFILEENKVLELIDEIKKRKIFAIDLETTDKNPLLAKIVGISISFKENEAFYIPLAHTCEKTYSQLDFNKTLSLIEPLISDEKYKKIGQNIKYDKLVLENYNINIKGIYFDTMLASYLLNPSKRNHSLDNISLELFDYKKISYEKLTKIGKKTLNFADVDIEKASFYACEDADMTFSSYIVLKEKLKENNLYDLFKNIEMPLLDVLSCMEKKGVLINEEMLKKLSLDFEKSLKDLEKKIYDLSGEQFNINSPQQLAYILFEKLNFETKKKTKKKTNYSTDVDVLKELSYKNELPALILEYRTLAKLKSTYTDSLLEIINKKTKRIHTSYNQTITATGRLSSTKPNLQNIPIRDEKGRKIRQAFICKEDFVLMAFDYSQIELRILAHYSDDEILKEAFLKDEDIHRRTAIEIFGIFPEMITDDLRRQAKAVNFGIIYGMSPFGLSKELNISQKMAKRYIENYFERYENEKNFIDKAILDAREKGFSKTLLNRIRYLPELKSKNKNIENFGERIAVNTIVQGSAADLIKLAMINIHKKIKENNLKSSMILTVHDELVFEVLKKEAEFTEKMVKKEMEEVYKLNVPLKVNIGCGGNWSEAH